MATAFARHVRRELRRISHLGSAFGGAFYPHVNKDLRRALGLPVTDAWSRPYCGGGDLAACRAALWDSLGQAATDLEAEFSSPNVADWKRGMDYEDVRHSAVGVTTVPAIHWINRPTFQQVVQMGSDPVDADDDNDGQSDADEIACGSSPVDPASRSPDSDADGVPDCLDGDDDNDGVLDASDNCAAVPNPGREDADGDGFGDACDHDVRISKFSTGGRGLTLGTNGTATRQVLARCQSLSPHTDLVRCTVEILSLPSGCTAQNLATGTTVASPGGLVVDDTSSYLPSQEKKFDFQLRISCSPNPPQTAIALIARADHDGDDGLGLDDEDTSPANNRVTRLHRLKQ